MNSIQKVELIIFFMKKKGSFLWHVIDMGLTSHVVNCPGANKEDDAKNKEGTFTQILDCNYKKI